ITITAFVIGGVIGAFVFGHLGRANPNLTVANVMLSSVADDLKIANALRFERLSRGKAAKLLERSAALSLAIVREVHPDTKKLSYHALLGLCAAYVYVEQEGYSSLNDYAVQQMLKSYLRRHGPAAVQRLESVRSSLNQVPFKPEY